MSEERTLALGAGGPFSKRVDLESVLQTPPTKGSRQSLWLTELPKITASGFAPSYATVRAKCSNLSREMPLAPTVRNFCHQTPQNNTILRNREQEIGLQSSSFHGFARYACILRFQSHCLDCFSKHSLQKTQKQITNSAIVCLAADAERCCRCLSTFR